MNHLKVNRILEEFNFVPYISEPTSALSSPYLIERKGKKKSKINFTSKKITGRHREKPHFLKLVKENSFDLTSKKLLTLNALKCSILRSYCKSLTWINLNENNLPK